MNKFLLFSFVFSSILSTQTQAQDYNKGKEILAKVSKKYKSYTTVKADFKSVMNSPQDKINLEQKGTFFLRSNSNKYKVDMGAQTITSDGKKVWTYVKEANEVQIDNFNPKNGLNPAEIFTIYEKGYIYAYMGDEGGLQLVELTPKDKTQSIFKVKLFIDKINSNIRRAKIIQKDGSNFTYEITTFTPNFPLNNAFFIFDKTKFPKVIVTDLTK
ncbi:MAG: outer membrane lipoprotein carrier protein LolA [Bacteroidetes bacterium]|nr:outer membrane lipoprotein carrier protein LolA [Bacteroidota bacterium]